MVIIRIKANLDGPDVNKVIQSIHAQAAMGVIVLPNYCELLNEVPADEEIVVRYADNNPLFCSGCDYLKTYREAMLCDYPKAPRLLCPHHYNRGGPVYCPNWDPYREGCTDG
jgi:hypothetical protein